MRPFEGGKGAAKKWDTAPNGSEMQMARITRPCYLVTEQTDKPFHPR